MIFGVAANVVRGSRRGWRRNRRGPDRAQAGDSRVVGRAGGDVGRLALRARVDDVLDLELLLCPGWGRLSRALEPTSCGWLRRGGKERCSASTPPQAVRCHFLAPGLFALFSGVFDSPRMGIIGIVLVLLAGLLALSRVDRRRLRRRSSKSRPWLSVEHFGRPNR